MLFQLTYVVTWIYDIFISTNDSKFIIHKFNGELVNLKYQIFTIKSFTIFYFKKHKIK